MSTAPLVLGINRTQDASVCLARGDDIVWHVQKERITRVKQHWGALDDVRNVYRPRLPQLSEPLTLIVEVWHSIGLRHGLERLWLTAPLAQALVASDLPLRYGSV